MDSFGLFWIHPPKNNMAPENRHLEKDIPIGNHDFKGSWFVFWGVPVFKKYTGQWLCTDFLLRHPIPSKVTSWPLEKLPGPTRKGGLSSFASSFQRWTLQLRGGVSTMLWLLFFVVLFHHQMGESTSFTEISGPLKISFSFQGKFFGFFFFVGGTGHNKCVGKNVPNDSGAPVKMGATIYMRGQRCKSLRPRNCYHTIVSPQAMEFCPGEPTRNLDILDGETGVPYGRTDFVHGLSWKCRPRYLGNTSLGLRVCVNAGVLKSIPSQNYRNAFNAFIQDTERTDGCFSKIIYRNRWIWRKPSYFRLSSKQMATIAPSYFPTQDLWRIDVDIAQRSSPKYSTTFYVYISTSKWMVFSVFNKWLHLRDVGNFLGNIHVTFKQTPPRKINNPKMNTKIVPQTTPPYTSQRWPGNYC